MRPIAKRKFEDLEQAILAYYEEQEQLNNRITANSTATPDILTNKNEMNWKRL